jgi:hypothetical protein
MKQKPTPKQLTKHDLKYLLNLVEEQAHASIEFEDEKANRLANKVCKKLISLLTEGTKS